MRDVEHLAPSPGGATDAFCGTRCRMSCWTVWPGFGLICTNCSVAPARLCPVQGGGGAFALGPGNAGGRDTVGVDTVGGPTVGGEIGGATFGALGKHADGAGSTSGWGGEGRRLAIAWIKGGFAT